jgi:hypothetical protein
VSGAEQESVDLDLSSSQDQAGRFLGFIKAFTPTTFII